MQIPVTVPAMLAHATGEQRHFTIDATTLGEVIAQVKAKFPLLVPLVWEADGSTRKHVLVFLNDTPTRWLDEPNPTLKDGDTVTIVQAISGGVE